MIYFSYNDFIDYSENGKIEEVTKVSENITKYELTNGLYKKQEYEEKIIQILKNKEELKKFLREFFNMEDIEKINYCNNKKMISKENIIICKIKEKEIFILIKVIENIDNNITYKMFEHSIKIIEEWNKQENIINKRYPIVIPIVLYLGKEIWKNDSNKTYNKINYMTYEDNKIHFSYNIAKINEIQQDKLRNMKCKVAQEIIKLSNKYLQIN